MARDYLAIPGSSCLAKWSFSMAARTNDCCRWQLKSTKFEGLQRLRSAYQDGHLKAVEEASMQIKANFSLDSGIDDDLE